MISNAESQHSIVKTCCLSGFEGGGLGSYLCCDLGQCQSELSLMVQKWYFELGLSKYNSLCTIFPDSKSNTLITVNKNWTKASGSLYLAIPIRECIAIVLTQLSAAISHKLQLDSCSFLSLFLVTKISI